MSTAETAPARSAPSGPMLDSAGDARRRSALRRMRFVATGLLVLAATVFVATHGHGGVWGYVNAASEAAMVGAVADWFAVTALFRHPLGLPIPHTAIIPERKDSIGENLEEFVTENFLTADNVQERLAGAQVARRIGEWLAEPVNARRVVDQSAPALARAVGNIKDEDVKGLLDRVLLPRVAREPVSELLGTLLEGIVDDGSHHGLVDLTARELHAWVRDNRSSVTSIISERAPSWSPKWLDDTVSTRLHTEIVKWLEDIRDNPNHPVRGALDNVLRQLADQLQHDPDTMQQTEALKVRLLSHPNVSTSLLSLWRSGQTVLVDALNDPDGDLRVRLARLIGDTGQRLVTDPELQAAVDRRISEVAGHLVSTYGRELSSVISQTIQRWDGKEASERIELHVGRDLQFIRINGTVVGGLVGLLIYTVSQFL